VTRDDLAGKICGPTKQLKANLQIPCRAHAVPLPCRVAKDLGSFSTSGAAIRCWPSRHQ
jgi:hypothetical protein